MSTTLQTESLKLNVETEIRQTESDNGGHDDANPQTASAIDDYDAKLSLIHRAFNEISRLCFEHDYHLTPEDWAALDAARLDPLPYEELRTVLRHVYRQIKRKAQAKLTNHSRS